MKASFFIKILQGVIIGMGFIAPGLSGSTIAVSMGIYESIIGACSGLITDFKHIKKHLFFLLPYSIGIGIGILALAQVINWMFNVAPVLSTFIFIGLLLGSFPNIIDSANKNGFKMGYILFSLLFFTFSVALGYFAKIVGAGQVQADPSLSSLFLYGAIWGLGTIIPGLSSSFMLMSIGGYETTMGAISGFDLARLLPIALGMILVIAVCVKFINYMVERFQGYLYYSMLGLVFGSVVTVLPVMQSLKELILSILVCILCTIISYFSFKINSKMRIHSL